MDEMKITATQITELYAFTRQHFVEHYDVQTELVDHLANDIEHIWKAHPALSFQEARTMSFKKFGVFGFMDVVAQKQKAMNQHYWTILLRFAKEWFSLPKIVSTLLLFLIFYTLLQFSFAKEIILIALGVLVLLNGYILFKNRHREKNKKKDKVFLLESMIGSSRNGISFISLINLFNLGTTFDIPFFTLEMYWQVLIAFIATLLCILYYITAVVMPSKAEELLAETYPEYKML